MKVTTNYSIEKKRVEKFQLAGILVRSKTALDVQNDIGLLWHRFQTEKIAEKIQNKLSDDIFCAYTAYESDYKGRYTTFIGCKIPLTENCPAGLELLVVQSADYHVYTQTGKVPEIVIEMWSEIWSSPIPRAYQTDFDVYSSHSLSPDEVSVQTFVSIIPT